MSRRRYISSRDIAMTSKSPNIVLLFLHEPRPDPEHSSRILRLHPPSPPPVPLFFCPAISRSYRKNDLPASTISRRISSELGMKRVGNRNSYYPSTLEPLPRRYISRSLEYDKEFCRISPASCRSRILLPFCDRFIL